MTGDNMDLLKYENKLYDEGIKYIAGVDEVGRGPLAGPVVTGAVILPKNVDILYLNDSKKLSKKRREEARKKEKADYEQKRQVASQRIPMFAGIAGRATAGIRNSPFVPADTIKGNARISRTIIFFIIQIGVRCE